jgi:hypothetical protein
MMGQFQISGRSRLPLWTAPFYLLEPVPSGSKLKAGNYRGL